MAKNFDDDEDIYVSVLLDDYIDLTTVRDFMKTLVEFGVEEWEGFQDALDEFLEDDDQRDDPRELI